MGLDCFKLKTRQASSSADENLSGSDVALWQTNKTTQQQSIGVKVKSSWWITSFGKDKDRHKVMPRLSQDSLIFTGPIDAVERSMSGRKMRNNEKLFTERENDKKGHFSTKLTYAETKKIKSLIS